MNDIMKVFTVEEIEEIEVCRDLTDSMSVDGKEIVCFKLLYEIIINQNSISFVPKENLLNAYAQLVSFKETLKSGGIIDTSLLESITIKSRKIISEEINKRKSKKLEK